MLIDFEGAYRLLAAVIKQAVKEAKQGQQDALIFLDGVFPEWRKYA